MLVLKLNEKQQIQIEQLMDNNYDAGVCVGEYMCTNAYHDVFPKPKTHQKSVIVPCMHISLQRKCLFYSTRNIRSLEQLEHLPAMDGAEISSKMHGSIDCFLFNTQQKQKQPNNENHRQINEHQLTTGSTSLVSR